MRAPEVELLSELDAHDALVTQCARGELTWEEFERAYDSFYPRYPLDGHASDADEQRLFETYASRIALHHEIWEQVLTKVTADEHPREPSAANAGFIGTAEAVRRIQLCELVLGVVEAAQRAPHLVLFAVNGPHRFHREVLERMH